MRLLRFHDEDGTALPGLLEGDAIIELEGDIFGGYAATSRVHPLAQTALLPPVVPQKIVALATNFIPHAAEMKKAVPDEPRLFLKAPSALIGHRAPIRLPPHVGSVEHEAEAAVVIGKRARAVREEEALSVVFGLTAFNDVTARELQRRDGVFGRAKGFDTFAPCGPWIDTEALWDELLLECRVNGELRQSARLCEMIFPLPRIIAFVSRVMTLEPGDLIALGTPAGVGPLQDGDTVEVLLEGVGALVNPVRAG
ncbi:MAG: fumarylacetoacetate hydrolase family protein [Myxococcales bacterium]|nr:fumarylacetoacetate hydrolase family protein [Myxococcales bacterium]